MRKLVIKVGGAFLEQTDTAFAFIQTLKTLQQKYQIVLVHGGGDLVEDLFGKLGFVTEKVDGLRVTPEAQLPYLVGALAGTANKQLLSLAIKAKVNAVSLCLADGNTSECEAIDARLGAVGQVVSGKAKLLEMLLEQGYMPLVSSIGSDVDGQLLNVNADQAATALAKILDADLLLLSNVPGVLGPQKQLIPELLPQQMAQLINENIIRDGMIVKVKAAQEAATTLQKAVTIASWQHPQTLVELLNNGQIGTQVFPQSDTKEAL